MRGETLLQISIPTESKEFFLLFCGQLISLFPFN
jgi:hypothetical protein